MIEITPNKIAPEKVINSVKNDDSGCVVSYVGLIRSHSNGKNVASVTYVDKGTALNTLSGIVDRAKARYRFTKIAVAHRTGELAVGDINLVVAVAAGHRKEGFEACQYIIDKFKETLPTHKTEIYKDGSSYTRGEMV